MNISFALRTWKSQSYEVERLWWGNRLCVTDVDQESLDGVRTVRPRYNGAWCVMHYVNWGSEPLSVFYFDKLSPFTYCTYTVLCTHSPVLLEWSSNICSLWDITSIRSLPAISIPGPKAKKERKERRTNGEIDSIHIAIPALQTARRHIIVTECRRENILDRFRLMAETWAACHLSAWASSYCGLL